MHNSEYTKTTELYTLKGDFNGMWVIIQKKNHHAFFLNSDSRASKPESIQKLRNGAQKCILKISFPGTTALVISILRCEEQARWHLFLDVASILHLLKVME